MRRLLARALAATLVSTSALAATDNDPPVIVHTPTTSAPAGDSVQLFARITDASKFYPQVFFRYDSSGEYLKPIDMKPVKGEPHMFGANVPVKGPVLEYYLEAYDEYGNGPGRAGSPEKPIHVRVGEQPVASAPPPGAAPAVPPAAAPPSAGEGWGTPSAAKAPALATSRAQPTEPMRIWTWAVGGAGVGLLAGGLLAGLAARTAGDAYNARLKDPQNNPVTLQSQYDAAQGMGSKATILTVSGALLVAGGGALYFFEPGFYAGSGVSVAAGPVGGGGTVAVASRF